LQHFAAVRDLLAPPGQATDLSEATAYQVAVPFGDEAASAERYAADPAVYAAGLDRETIGTLTPNASMPHPRTSMLTLLGLTSLFIAALLILLGGSWDRLWSGTRDSR
jgi:hypothetical protein